MYNLTKKEKLNFILEKVEELGFTAYEISKDVNLTEAGIARILKGVAKNPHETSLNEIILFLEKKVLGSNLSTENNKVEEPEPTYNKTEIDSDSFKNCLQEVNILTREIITLQGLLRRNNIDFKNIFEKEN
jgi:hypothetical protein